MSVEIMVSCSTSKHLSGPDCMQKHPLEKRNEPQKLNYKPSIIISIYHIRCVKTGSLKS